MSLLGDIDEDELLLVMRIRRMKLSMCKYVSSHILVIIKHEGQ